MKNALILSTVSGFLYKFEKENVRLLQKLGYSVHYAANMEEQQYRFNPSVLEEMNVTAHHISIARAPKMVGMNTNAYKQTKEIVEKYDIQLIHCHTPMGGFIGRLLRKDFGNKLKIIYTAHGFHFYKEAPLHRKAIFYLAEKLMARVTDALITVNREDYEAASKFKLRQGGKLYQIPGVGLDYEYFSPCTKEEKSNIRSINGLGKDIFHLATVGEINENKNHIVVLEALEIMKQNDSSLGNKMRYSIWGDGFFKERLEQEIRKRNLEDVVTLEGYGADVRYSLSTVDAFVFPSIREGLGMAAIEALAMGIPTIASDNRGTREFMRHKINGYVCAKNRPERYIEGIEFLLNRNEEERKKMEKQCIEGVLPFCKCNTNTIMDDVYHYIDEVERVQEEILCMCSSNRVTA